MRRYTLEFAALLIVGIIFGISGLLIVQDAVERGKIIDTLKDWQTLIAGMIALIAAWITLRPAYGQLNAATKQSLVSARSTANEILSSLQFEINVARDAERLLRDTGYRVAYGAAPMKDIRGEVFDLSNRLRDTQFSFNDFAGRDPRNRIINQLRDDFLSKIDKLATLVEELRYTLDSALPIGIALGTVGAIRPVSELTPIILAAQEQCKAALSAYLFELEKDKKVKLSKIRDIEDKIFQ